MHGLVIGVISPMMTEAFMKSLISISWYKGGQYAHYKQCKLPKKAHQLNGSKRPTILWHMKHCSNAVIDLNSMTCKLLEWNKIKSYNKNKIMISNGDIILDHHIKTHDVG